MVSMYRLQELCRQYNDAGAERQLAQACSAGQFLRSLGMTPDQLDRYQARVEGIGDRLTVVTSRMRKPPRLFR